MVGCIKSNELPFRIFRSEAEIARMLFHRIVLELILLFLIWYIASYFLDLIGICYESQKG